MNTAVANPLDVKLMNLTTLVLVISFCVLGALAAARWASRLAAFDIKGIVVTGDVNHNNALTLRANVAPRIAGTLFTVDLGRVRAAFESVPWVRHAVVRRGFPNRLLVELQEHTAVGYWEGESDLRLINSYGEVFEANLGEVEQEHLPRFAGPEGQSTEVLAMYRAVSPLFESMEMPLERLQLTNGGSWRVQTEAGAAIELGRGSTEDVVSRVQRFLKTLTQVTSRFGQRRNGVESADLRHDNGYALRLHGVTTIAPAPPTK